MSKVLVGMSGGVDSAVAAYLLKKQGYEVVGVTLRTWEAEDEERRTESLRIPFVDQSSEAPLIEDQGQNRCCEIDDARYVCHRIGIPFYALNCKGDFRKHVTEPFMDSYVRGETPNPCVECNRYVKWERMMYYAKVLKADYIATGHYADKVLLPNGRYTVKCGADAKKDQTYMMYKLTQEQLSVTLFPLSGMTKEEVRRIAKEADLPIANKPDSQEICFVPDGDYAGYIEANYTADKALGSTGTDRREEHDPENEDDAKNNTTADNTSPGTKERIHRMGSFAEGNFVDESGHVLGRHKGIIHYTVGQRKGLGLSVGHPVFVKEINAEKNEVVISEEEALFSREVICREINLLSIEGLSPGEKISCSAKIRYRHNRAGAVLEGLDNDRIKLTFDEPVRAATPGQSAVFYDEKNHVIGGGIICR